MTTTNHVEPSAVWLRMVSTTSVDCVECGRAIQPNGWYIGITRGASDQRPGAIICQPCWRLNGVQDRYVPMTKHEAESLKGG